MNALKKKSIIRLIQVIAWGVLAFRAIFVRHDSMLAVLAGMLFVLSVFALYQEFREQNSN